MLLVFFSLCIGQFAFRLIFMTKLVLETGHIYSSSNTHTEQEYHRLYHDMIWRFGKRQHLLSIQLLLCTFHFTSSIIANSAGSVPPRF